MVEASVIAGAADGRDEHGDAVGEIRQRARGSATTGVHLAEHVVERGSASLPAPLADVVLHRGGEARMFRAGASDGCFDRAELALDEVAVDSVADQLRHI